MTETKAVVLKDDLVGRGLRRVPKQYKLALKSFQAHLRETGKELTLETVQGYLDQKKKRGYVGQDGVSHRYTAAGFNHHVSALKALVRVIFDKSPELTAAQRLELTEGLAKIKLRKRSAADIQVGESKVLSAEEQRTLLEGSPDRERLIMLFLLATGCRISEALNIQLDQVRPAGGHVDIRILGKGDKERTLQVPTELVDRIKACYQGGVYLFESNRKGPYRREYIHRRVRDLGIRTIARPLYPHMLRHTFATRMIEEHPEQLASISGYLGHARVSTTVDLYVHQKLEYDTLAEHYKTLQSGGKRKAGKRP
ncbi:Tyrosine recombinase XerC [subsurface metagenome]